MKKLEKIQVTIQELWAAARPHVHKNQKKYSRKTKHKNESNRDDPN